MSAVIYYPGYSQVQVTDNLVIRIPTSISNAYPMIVQTSVNHRYVIGMKVRFQIPKMFGMQELNELEGQVIDLTDDQLAINIDSTRFSPFAYPVSLPQSFTYPSIIPNSSGPYLPPLPLPFGNQTSFKGVIFNNGTQSNPIS